MTMLELEKIIRSGTKLTPMMEQYYSIKKNYKDHLLLFRMGDFYEVFFEDALQVSQGLNIVLTHRGKLGESPIPMAGIPHHAAATYIDRLTSYGHRVAICEQVEDAADAKGIVKRGVTQVVSEGMPYDLDKVEGRGARYLVAAYKQDQHYYLATLDFTTGEFLGQTFEEERALLHRLQLISPKELITYMGQWEELKELDCLCKNLGILKTHLSREYFEAKHANFYLEKLIPRYREDETLQRWPTILNPIGAIAYYIISTQQLDHFIHIKPFRLLNEEKRLRATLSTLMGLEILPRTPGSYKESLLGFLDCTQTSMGSRRLRDLVTEPLSCKSSIEQRYCFIDFLLKGGELLQKTRKSLKNVYDLERILAKVSTKKVKASDLINLARSIQIYFNFEKGLIEHMKNLVSPLAPPQLQGLRDLAGEIEKTLNDEIGASLEKGNLIKEGIYPERDRLAQLNTDTSLGLKELEKRYQRETGILKLRVKSNNTAGYFVEVSQSYIHKVPPSFRRRQTLTNSERYTTQELDQFEKEILSAQEKLQRWEKKIFNNLLVKVHNYAGSIHTLAHNLSFLDCFVAMAWVTQQEGFTRPCLKQEKGIMLQGVWHPLIKNLLHDEFISHDLTLNEKNYFGLITGPNMAGKTTVMREMAIVQVLAQMGCYVPAEKAELSLCDYLFSRVGASDDLASGRSTFMVEMTEMAEIIRHVSENSMVILDEVGRGTSTYDGLSLAWALVEYLVIKIKPLGLFATHYRELIELVEQLSGAKNLTVEVRNIEGKIQFLYRLMEGGANQSFGIYVAQLAGLPKEILSRSQQILNQLEKRNAHQNSSQLSFFETFENQRQESVPSQKIPPHLLQLEEGLKELDISEMTPLEALNKLSSLQNSLH